MYRGDVSHRIYKTLNHALFRITFFAHQSTNHGRLCRIYPITNVRQNFLFQDLHFIRKSFTIPQSVNSKVCGWRTVFLRFTTSMKEQFRQTRQRFDEHLNHSQQYARLDTEFQLSPKGRTDDMKARFLWCQCSTRWKPVDF